MKGIVRLLIIIVVAVIGIGVAAFFLLPDKRTYEATLEAKRPAQQMYAWLALAPADTELTKGLKLTRVISANAETRTIEGEVAYADGTAGTATFVVEPSGDAASNIRITLNQPIGGNPIDKYMAPFNNTFAPTGEGIVTALTASVNGDGSGACTDGDGLECKFSSELRYEIVNVAAKQFIYTGGADVCAPINPAEIRRAVNEILPVVDLVMRQRNLTPDGLPVAVELSWNEAPHENEYCFQIGYPFSGPPPQERLYAGGVNIGTTPSGRAMRVQYIGSEEEVLPVYEQMEALAEAGHLTLGRSFEVYYPTAEGQPVKRDIYYIIQSGDVNRLRTLLPSAGPVPPQETLTLAPAAASEAPPAEQPAATPTTTTESQPAAEEKK